MDEDLAQVGVVVQKGEELGAVLVAEEDRLAIVAARGQVEGVRGYPGGANLSLRGIYL